MSNGHNLPLLRAGPEVRGMHERLHLPVIRRLGGLRRVHSDVHAREREPKGDLPAWEVVLPPLGVDERGRAQGRIGATQTERCR